MSGFLSLGGMLLGIADPSTAGSLDLFALLMGLFGGLALFLMGMGQMSDSLKAVAGERMRSVLSKLTSNRLMGVLTGTFVTAIIQSSSVTTVLVVGFISAGLMSLSQSIGIILGANIGTTITAQIIAFKVTKYALLLVAVGFGLSIVPKRERLRYQGTVLMGLGLIFLGMGVMGEAMAPLRTYQPFLDLMTHMESPLVGILVATAFTALVQSSSATTGIVIVLAGQGLLTLPAGIALIFGANIGTCVTAVLASVGRPREAVRAATVHVIFKIIGVMIWLPFIDQLVDIVIWMSPAAEHLEGATRLATEAPRQIANAHTVFNVANTVLFLPFSTQFARLVQWMVPERPLREEEEIIVKYLDSELLGTPSLALDRARLEMLRLGERVRQMLTDSLRAVLSGSRSELEGVAKQDDAVDQLHGKIITYLGQIGQTKLTEKQTDELIKLMAANNDLEAIGDIIETNLVALGLRRVANDVVVSEPTRQVIETFHREVVNAYEAAMTAVSEKSERSAAIVVGMKQQINDIVAMAEAHEAQRLVADSPKRLEAYTFEMDVIENLKRIYYFCKRIARSTQGQEPTSTVQ
ncbi:MAG: Na/Pi cotransporter family protein [Thermoanaerobaculia bacterium]|nr:Na/Pi cotransporter family protein [Thermoanaerobaculia bacterium]